MLHLGVQLMLIGVPATVTETQEPPEVCVVLMGTRERPVTVIIDFENIDTTQEDLSNTQETFVFGSGGTEQECFQLLINTDEMLENSEAFNIVVSNLTDGVVDVINGNFRVMIQDSSTLELGFLSVPLSIEEGASFEVCVGISRGSLSEGFLLPLTIVTTSRQGEQCSVKPVNLFQVL